jgi:hypothetical protein
MTIGFPQDGRVCSQCKLEIPKHLYNKHLYCAPMAGCFNFCSDECYHKWYDGLKKVLDRDSQK